MSYQPTPDDMAVLKEQGTLVEFLLSTTGRSRKKTRPPSDDAPAIDVPIRDPRHRPGAWPTGTRPAGPNTCDPGCPCALIKPGES